MVDEEAVREAMDIRTWLGEKESGVRCEGRRYADIDELDGSEVLISSSSAVDIREEEIELLRSDEWTGAVGISLFPDEFLFNVIRGMRRRTIVLVH